MLSLASNPNIFLNYVFIFTQCLVFIQLPEACR